MSSERWEKKPLGCGQSRPGADRVFGRAFAAQARTTFAAQVFDVVRCGFVTYPSTIIHMGLQGLLWSARTGLVRQYSGIVRYSQAHTHTHTHKFHIVGHKTWWSLVVQYDPSCAMMRTWWPCDSKGRRMPRSLSLQRCWTVTRDRHLRKDVRDLFKRSFKELLHRCRTSWLSIPLNKRSQSLQNWLDARLSWVSPATTHSSWRQTRKPDSWQFRIRQYQPNILFSGLEIHQHCKGGFSGTTVLYRSDSESWDL